MPHPGVMPDSDRINCCDTETSGVISLNTTVRPFSRWNARMSKRYEHVSLRIPLEVREGLLDESKSRVTNLNALATRILTKYVSFDRMMELEGPVVLTPYLLSNLANASAVNALVETARVHSGRFAKHAFALYRVEPTLDNLITRYFEPMGLFSGWFRFSCGLDPLGESLVFEHNLGENWTKFLECYITGVIRSVLGTEPEVRSDLGLILAHVGRG